jgi:histone-lysine N-methyltransferase SETD2
LNRTLFYECDSRFCPCGEACGNQRFQRRQYCRIEMRRAGRKGHGLFAGQRIRKGDFIVEYVGEVLEERAYAARKEAYAEAGQRHFYFMSLGGAEVIDACARGNLARFVNHSCAPNCETQKWMVAGELCIGMFATADVEAGQELTFDYNFERYGDAPMRCLCAAKGCRGWIGGAGDGAPPSDEEADSEPEDEPAPVMLASDGAEHAAFERAVADHAAAEGARDARRERERAERVARRKAAESRVRRSSSTPGGGAKSRRSSAGVAGTPGATGVPFMKRSEVERRLDELLSPAGALKNKEAVKPLLRLFALALAAGAASSSGGGGGGDENNGADGAPGAPAAAAAAPAGGADAACAAPASSGPAVSARDMSLLLEAVVRTASAALQKELLAASCLNIFNMALPRLSGAGREMLAPVLRKLLRAMDGLPVGREHLEKMRCAGQGNSLLASLHKLMTSADTEAARRARELCIKLASLLPSGGGGMQQQQQQQQQQHGVTPASGMRPHDAPGRSAMMGTPMAPMGSLSMQQQQQQRTPGSAAPMYQQQYPPPPPHMGWQAQQHHGGGIGGMDDRAAKRPRWGAGMHDTGNGHGGGALPPPPPLPQEDYPLPPPPPRDMDSMELAPVRSPARNGGGDAEERSARGGGGGAGAGGSGSGGSARPSAPVCSPGGGDGGGAAVAPVYCVGTPVPWPTKADVARLPAAWDDPFGHTFKAGVLVLVAYRLGKYRQADHPLAKLVRPGADAMALKLASKVVDRERRRAEEHRGRGAPPAVACEKLSDKIRVFVSEHVHAMEKAARAGGMVR